MVEPPTAVRLFYRRIKPNQWEDYGSARPLPNAFYINEGEDGLSVFDSLIASADDALEAKLVELRALLASDSANDQKYATKNLEKFRHSVEGMKDLNWGVVAISESVFVRLGFDTNVPVDPNGHLAIGGSSEEFELNSGDLAESCVNALESASQ